MTIDEVDRTLQQWVKGLLPDVAVTLGLTPHPAGTPGVSLYLRALADPLPAWAHWPSARRIALSYLITTWGEEEEAHALLSTLVFAALEQPEYELDLTPLPASMWTALGLVPRPAFTLQVPCALARPVQSIPLVRGPLVVEAAPARSLHGIVLGPGDLPLAGAGVEMPALQLRARTDTRGHFSFSMVPGGTQRLQLVAKAKGRVQNVTVEQSTIEAEPLIIRFDSFDEDEVKKHANVHGTGHLH